MDKHDTPDTGGLAFPNDWAHENGMTLLDWFAGQALAGYLASFAGAESDASPIRSSERAYDYAAAMVAEKRRREGK